MTQLKPRYCRLHDSWLSIYAPPPTQTNNNGSGGDSSSSLDPKSADAGTTTTDQPPSPTPTTAPLDIITLKGATLLSTADFKAKKDQFYSLHLFSTHNKQQYMLYANNEQDWKEWSQLIDETIVETSDERLIHEHSLSIHRFVLQQIYKQQSEQKDSNGRSGATSPHSPYNFSNVSFHRSIPLNEATCRRVLERIVM